MDRVIFIPFEQPMAYEFLERTNSWVQERPEKNFRVVIYNPQRAVLGMGANPQLMNLVKGSHIYLRGHGLPGDHHVVTNLQGGGTRRISIQESIDRLIEMGLDRNFRGTIKFYSCYSGVASKDKWQSGTGQLILNSDPMKTKVKGGTFAPGAVALAKVGADYFRSLGFKHCKYVGYLGPLTGKYEDSDSSPDGAKHKYCEIVSFDALGDKHFLQPSKSIRASDARKKF